MRRLLRTGPGKLGAILLPLILGSAVSYFLGADFWKRVEDWLGTSGPPLSVQVIVDVDRFHSDAPHYPDFVLPRTIDRVPASPAPEDTTGRWAWAHRMNGVDANGTLVRLVIKGTSDDEVVLQDARVRVVSRRSPIRRGVFITDDGRGAGQPVRYFEAALDTHPATLSYIGSRGGPEAHFPLRVSKTATEVFDIEASSSSCDCSWVVELDYTTGDDMRTITVDDHGHPFRTTAATAFARLPADPPQQLDASWTPGFIWLDGRWERSELDAVACGPESVRGRSLSILGRGAGADCADAAPLMREYLNRARREGQGSAGALVVDDWYCAALSAAQFDSTGVVALCNTASSDDLVVAVDSAHAATARLKTMAEVAKRTQPTDQ